MGGKIGNFPVGDFAPELSIRCFLNQHGLIRFFNHKKLSPLKKLDKSRREKTHDFEHLLPDRLG
jgi:hypothetical protein